MKAERQMMRGRVEIPACPIRPFAITLAIMGGAALVTGLWGLLRPWQLVAFGEAGEAVVTDRTLRFGAALLVWLAMVVLAWYVTARWQTLRWWQAAAGWILVTYLWIGGIVAMRVPTEPYQTVFGRVLNGDLSPRVTALVGVLAGLTLLALAATASREPRPAAATQTEARRGSRAGTPDPLPRPSPA